MPDPDSTENVSSERKIRKGPHWLRGVAGGAVTALIVGVPTDILDTTLFSREIPVRWWEYPVFGATVLLTALWFGIQSPPRGEERPTKTYAGVMLAVFAVGCPVCNKLVVAALGVSGALGVWAPIQPILAAVSLALLTMAVAYRWRRRDCSDIRCEGNVTVVG
ncbi:hypothetical protein [Rhodococcus erythropolis]|uniref:hypothetical protein n=1 Tax=Rhodococcus erythropolis TaxID=1833 RepID=UPI0022267724|nr:hypothetical protein [Rhodococcus erythropolis]MCW2298136.1 hypothetical protein [Rhodococcus erythropolis]